MRNWNACQQWRRMTIHWVFIVPMRNWNMLYLIYNAINQILFLSYLWGIETIEKAVAKYKVCKVFIVPMRNWNQIIKQYNSTDRKSFYRTYEELKRERDSRRHRSVYKFLSYLWGIETLTLFICKIFIFNCFYRTYEELKLSLNNCMGKAVVVVFIVPMRNWNII